LSPIARLLQPAASLYGYAVALRYQCAQPYRSVHPVVCVGNFTAGGTGKTPMTRYVVNLLRTESLVPVVLSRGYGGSIAGPHLVDPARDQARDVGDEPLMMTADAPVVVSRRRAAGARAIDAEAFGSMPAGTVMVMDDGLQNPGLAKDLTIAVMDGVRGLGNGRVIPAGPLREALASQLARTHAIVLNLGHNPSIKVLGNATALASRFAAKFSGPIVCASIQPNADTGWVAGSPVVAYAGIANPVRFVDTLRSLGADIRAHRYFRDHETLSERDASELLALAGTHGAELVTTEKDFVRLPHGLPLGQATHPASQASSELRARSRVIRVNMTFSKPDQQQLLTLLKSACHKPLHITPTRSA